MRRIVTYRRGRQMSESYLTAACLSISGGLTDAYTYITRGGVFANAQTGNIVLGGVHLFGGQWEACLHYLVPIVAYALGVAATYELRDRLCRVRKMHWRQVVLLIEIVALALVGFLPEALDDVANALVSFVCAMQVQAFRKVDGNAFASTMCTGNLRSGTEALCVWRRTHRREPLHKALRYFGIIFLFAAGAALGSYTCSYASDAAIWLSCALLVVAVLLMFVREVGEEQAVERAEEAILVDVGRATESVREFEHRLEDSISSRFHHDER